MYPIQLKPLDNIKQSDPIINIVHDLELNIP